MVQPTLHLFPSLPSNMSFLTNAQPLKSAFKHVRYFAMQTSNTSSVRPARGLPYPPSVAPSLIRRLPQMIPFACAEGKEYFKEAMDHGNAEGFFGLMGNFSSNALPQHGGQTSRKLRFICWLLALYGVSNS
jgi:hypothetical protein